MFCLLVAPPSSPFSQISILRLRTVPALFSPAPGGDFLKTARLEQQTQLTAQLEATQENEQAADEWLAVIRAYAQLEEFDRPTPYGL